ncbi:MAG: SDR family NAD(P)-dependent oxidoreductase, partial [Chloroflexi bacterium]|nr:SDR family NAD(P)-dependent oxidoreductase [Chloroflexota bacterium]
MALSFDNQIVAITGGTQGIGWAMAQAFADHGATVYACGYSQESLDNAVSEWKSLPFSEQIHLTQCDVTDRVAFEAWLRGIYEANGRFDILIHNAAYVQWADVSAMSIKQAQRSMQVGYDGMVVGI